MLTIHDRPYQLCDGVTRREWLRIGSLGLFGLSLPNLLQARQAETVPSSGFGKAKSCILLYLYGGPPQHETWDPKPDAPAEIRGDLRPIPTTVPGLQVSELMPQLARLADKYCVLRAVATNNTDHGASMYAMLTGNPYQMSASKNTFAPPNDHPHFGAVIGWLTRGQRDLPASIAIPERMDFRAPVPGENAGFLGRAADPWLLTCDPSAVDFQVPGLALPAEVPALRFDGRRALLEQVNRHLDAVDRSGVVDRYHVLSQQAFNLLRSPAARWAFDLDQEPSRLRARYGGHKFGQSVLLARRLVEAGVPMVQVNWPWTIPEDFRINPKSFPNHWDTHNQNTEMLKTQLMPPMDQASSALLEDLSQRGLLDQTLVIWMGEFGRTPKINAKAGRDHWGRVFSIALAGGGVRGGQVYGASDSVGGDPKEGRVGPEDLTATIFHCLGYHPDTEIRDRQGRPLPISKGEVIRHILLKTWWMPRAVAGIHLGVKVQDKESYHETSKFVQLCGPAAGYRCTRGPVPLRRTLARGRAGTYRCRPAVERPAGGSVSVRCTGAPAAPRDRPAR